MDFSNRHDCVPLVCDLDGTLTPADTTFELLLLFLRANPFMGWFQILNWLRQGRSSMKANLYKAVGEKIDAAYLPYCRALIESPIYQTAGHRALVSGAARPLVEKVARELGGFGMVSGTTSEVNLTSTAKASHLSAIYPQGFDYVGNSSDDITVWTRARRAYAVNAPSKVIAKAKTQGIELHVIVPRIPQIKPLLKAMRLHQWVKNTLIFVVPALNLSTLKLDGIVGLMALFLAFGLVASATYIINDLLDIQEDRKHHSKSKRPFAAGTLDIPTGIMSVLALFLASMAIAAKLDLLLVGMIFSYAIISLAYSLFLKQIVVVDVMTLALLFCWRVLAGSVALGVVTNVWFMTAVGLLFMSLACGKRCIELERKLAKLPASDGSAQTATILHGRGYQGSDFPVVLGLGLFTGMVAPLVVLIYVFLSGSSVVSYTPNAFLLAALLCFWVGRFWVLVNRGQVHDDPIVFALKDRTSFIVLATILGILVSEQLL